MTPKTIKQSPGFLYALTAILFSDLKDLSDKGMMIKVADKEYVIKVKILGMTGDQPALNWMTETSGTSSTFPCTFCDIKISSRRLMVLSGDEDEDITARRRRNTNSSPLNT